MHALFLRRKEKRTARDPCEHTKAAARMIRLGNTRGSFA